MRKVLTASRGRWPSGPACWPAPAQAEDKKFTIALIPGLTTDAFYITMRKGAEAAAKAVGADLVFQGAPEFNPVPQAPVLDAMIARKPDAILIAPTDKVQLVQPLKKAADAGIPVITVDTFIGTGKYQSRRRRRRLPALLHRLRQHAGRRASRPAPWPRPIGEKGKVYVSNVKPGISTTDQREEGFKDEMKNYPDIQVLETQYNDNDANKAASQPSRCSPAIPTSTACSAPTCSPPSAPPTACSRPARPARSGSPPSTRRASIVDNIKTGLVDIAIAQHPAEIGYYGVMSAYAHLTGQSIPVAIGTGFTVMDKSERRPARRWRAFIYKD